MEIKTRTAYEEAGRIIHDIEVDIGNKRPVSTPIHLVQYDNTLPVIAVKLYKDGNPCKLLDIYSARIRWKDSQGLIRYQEVDGRSDPDEEAYTKQNRTPNDSDWLTSSDKTTTIIPILNKIYIIKDPSGEYANERYKWNGTKYIKIAKIVDYDFSGTVIYFTIDVDMTRYYGEINPILELSINNMSSGTSPIPIVIHKNPIQEGDIEEAIKGVVLAPVATSGSYDDLDNKPVIPVALKPRIVEELPISGQEGILYLVPISSPETGDIYEEWIWVKAEDEEDYKYEKVGSTTVHVELDAESGEHIGDVGTPTVTKSFDETTGKFIFTFDYLKGETGATGPQGDAAGFGTPTATIDNTTGTPSVTVTASGPNTAKVFNFAFAHLKGETPDISGKVDKTSTPMRIYCTNTEGEQKAYPYGTSLEDWSLVQRGPNGVIKIGTPTDPSHGATKAYVDNIASDKMNKTNPTGTGAFSLNRKENTTIGTNSFVSGSESAALGTNSHAEGNKVFAIGNDSRAEGSNTVSAGGGSYGMGVGSEISLASNYTGGSLSFIINKNDFIKENYYIYSLDNSNIRVKITSITQTGATYQITTNTAISQNNLSSGAKIIVCTTSYGSYSQAIGDTVLARGNSSHAEGEYTYTEGVGSYATGSYTKALNPYEFACGKFNISHKVSSTFGNAGNTLFSIGNGSTEITRSNAFEVYQDGHAEVQQMGTTPNSVATRAYVDQISGVSLYKHEIILDISIIGQTYHQYCRLVVINTISTNMPTTNVYIHILDLVRGRGPLSVAIGQLSQNVFFDDIEPGTIYSEDAAGELRIRTNRVVAEPDIEDIIIVSQSTTPLYNETW